MAENDEKRPQGKREQRERQSARPADEEQHSDEQPENAAAYDGADPVGWDTRTHGELPSERAAGGDY